MNAQDLVNIAAVGKIIELRKESQEVVYYVSNIEEDVRKGVHDVDNMISMSKNLFTVSSEDYKRLCRCITFVMDNLYLEIWRLASLTSSTDSIYLRHIESTIMCTDGRERRTDINSFELHILKTNALLHYAGECPETERDSWLLGALECLNELVQLGVTYQGMHFEFLPSYVRSTFSSRVCPLISQVCFFLKRQVSIKIEFGLQLELVESLMIDLRSRAELPELLKMDIDIHDESLKIIPTFRDLSTIAAQTQKDFHPWWVESLGGDDNRTEYTDEMLDMMGEETVGTESGSGSQSWLSDFSRQHSYENKDKMDDNESEESTKWPSTPIGTVTQQQMIQMTIKNTASGVSDPTDITQRLPNSDLKLGELYHGRIFIYHVLDDVWRFESIQVVISNDHELTVNKPGSFRSAFKFYIQTNDDSIFESSITHSRMEFVGKRYFNLGNHDLKAYISDIRTQEMARYYAYKFSRSLNGAKLGTLAILPVYHIQIFAYESAQDIIDMFNMESLGLREFMKMTNNTGYVNDMMNVDIATAYSHYTWTESKGKLMVVDLQGWKSGRRHPVVALTDPAINSPTASRRLFLHANTRNYGYQRFWDKQHTECNKICEYLELKRPIVMNKTTECTQEDIPQE